jgi:hypothetical protein
VNRLAYTGVTGHRFGNRNWISAKEHLIQFDAGIVRNIDFDEPANLPIFPCNQGVVAIPRLMTHAAASHKGW